MSYRDDYRRDDYRRDDYRRDDYRRDDYDRRDDRGYAADYYRRSPPRRSPPRGDYGRRDDYYRRSPPRRSPPRDSYYGRRDDRGYDRYDRRSPPRRFRSPPRRNGGRRPPVQRTKYGIIVKNLSSATRWSDLKDEANRCTGDLCCFSEANKEIQGEGIITFMTREAMKNAFEAMQGKEMLGRPMELSYENEDTLHDDTDERIPLNNDHPGSSRGPRRDRSRSRSPRRY